MATLLAVLVGGFAGAMARQEAFSAVQERARMRFPVGILAVNLSGAFVLGLLFGLDVTSMWPHWLAIGVQTGFIGAYTTYSTWAVDSLTLARDSAPGLGVANLAGSLLAGVLLAWAGVSLGSLWLMAARSHRPEHSDDGGGTGLRVIVGVDGSPHSDLALRWACRRAGTCGDTVRAVCAWSLGASGEDWAPPPEEKAEGQRHAERVLREMVEAARREYPAIAVEAAAVEGSPARVLVEMSADAELLVVGTRGLGGFTGLVLGSVSHQCVHHARCPVTVVR